MSVAVTHTTQPMARAQARRLTTVVGTLRTVLMASKIRAVRIPTGRGNNAVVRPCTVGVLHLTSGLGCSVPVHKCTSGEMLPVRERESMHLSSPCLLYTSPSPRDA